jgi:membrane protein implicated in regulation of membrane protease activity
MTKQYDYDIDGLIGEDAIVVSKFEPRDVAQYMVKVRGELWRANSPDDLMLGENVKVLSVKRLTLTVGKISV